jgi:cell shape-determining protein MreC
MGVFLYATYLFVKSSVRENKSYVKSVTNYLKEYDEWYIEAEQKRKKAKDLESLFKITSATEGRLNVAI